MAFSAYSFTVLVFISKQQLLAVTCQITAGYFISSLLRHKYNSFLSFGTNSLFFSISQIILLNLPSFFFFLFSVFAFKCIAFCHILLESLIQFHKLYKIITYSHLAQIIFFFNFTFSFFLQFSILFQLRKVFICRILKFSTLKTPNYFPSGRLGNKESQILPKDNLAGKKFVRHHLIIR